MKNTTVFSSLELLLSFVGTGIAGFIYYHDRAHSDLPCTTGGGCDLVQASRWSHLYGEPVALFGLIGYVTLALLSVIKLTAESEKVVRASLILLLLCSLGGTAFSWYLQYVAAVFIGAFCIWCRSSAITMTLILISAITELLLSRHTSDLSLSSSDTASTVN